MVVEGMGETQRGSGETHGWSVTLGGRHGCFSLNLFHFW
jgi:hypothetical protein